MSKPDRSISFTVKFTETHLNELLKMCYLGDGKVPTVHNMTPNQFKAFEEEMKSNARAMVDEFVESTEDVEWLQDFLDEHFGVFLG